MRAISHELRRPPAAVLFRRGNRLSDAPATTSRRARHRSVPIALWLAFAAALMVSVSTSTYTNSKIPAVTDPVLSGTEIAPVNVWRVDTMSPPHGLVPFVGTWTAHEEILTIDSNGDGHQTYNDRSACPNAPMSGCGVRGTVDFTLTNVSGATATGTIAASSNPQNPIGGRVSITLVGGGLGLTLTVAGGDDGFPFCSSRDDSSRFCGS